jgi:hypothetical protein
MQKNRHGDNVENASAAVYVANLSLNIICK